MKQGLSKRERTLIFIAAVIVLVFLSVRFIIVPMNNLHSASLEKYEVLSAEKTLLELKLQNEDAARAAYDNAEKALKDIKGQYPAVMPNEEIDRILTGICLQNKLDPVVLQMSGPEPVKFEDETQASAEDDGSGEKAPESPAAFVTVKATMNLNGDYDSLKGLIDTVDNIDYIRIIRSSFSYARDTEKTGAPNISALFEITMLNDVQ